MDAHAACGWTVRRATIGQAGLLAGLIAVSFRDVARRFGLDGGNCPGHPSRITREMVERGFRLGTQFLLAVQGTHPSGCVGLRPPVEGASTLEKLAVHPDHRRRGLGRQLVDEALTLARQAGATVVEIGIIAGQVELRAWYEAIGFQAVRAVRYAHLPFAVLHLRKPLTPAS